VDSASRSAPAFSSQEQASVLVSALRQVFAQAPRYFAFPAVEPSTSVPVGLRAFPLGERPPSPPDELLSSALP
jgi:hypothetical protein